MADKEPNMNIIHKINECSKNENKRVNPATAHTHGRCVQLGEIAE